MMVCDGAGPPDWRCDVAVYRRRGASAGLGAGLAVASHVSMLDGYLATTPGGLTAVVALAVGGRTDTTFIVSVQVIRTFLMLAAAPVIARAIAARGLQETRKSD